MRNPKEAHYHYAVGIGSIVKTKPVTFREMKNDPVLGQKGLIRANLQGASGDPFSVEEYDAILGIMERKGQDISLLPRLEPLSYPDLAKISNERDVEKFLVEPLLERLGYTQDDWIRQMSIKMGRGERNYPDYAFDATTKWGEESEVNPQNWTLFRRFLVQTRGSERARCATVPRIRLG